MKCCFYMSILLACCLSLSLSAFAQICSPQTCSPGQCCAVQVCHSDGAEICVTSQCCTFGTGMGQNSAIATFNCGGEVSCGTTNARAHSMKFIVGTVHNNFSILVTPEEDTSGQSNGFCESGIPGDTEAGNPADPIDCRFVRFFGDPAYNNNLPPGPPFNPINIKVPRCYPYVGSPPNNHCVVYHVTDEFGGPTPKPGPTTYSGGVQKKIAWNTVIRAPRGYFHNPRMFDDPDDDHPPADTSNCPAIDRGNGNVFPYEQSQNDDNQFVCDITTFFDPSPNGVGADPTTGGGGRSFNDFVIAWRLCTAKQDDVEGDGYEQGDDGHEGDFEFCQRSKKMRFEERDTGTKMNGSMDAVTLSGNQAIVTGAGTLGDGTPVHYTAVVLGNAPVIGANHFAISWITGTGSVFQTSGALIDGYIAVHTP